MKMHTWLARSNISIYLEKEEKYHSGQFFQIKEIR